MSFDWADYLALAGHLVSSAAPPLTEAQLRSGISRAYYAVFGKAKIHCETRDGVTLPYGGDVHKAVCDHFKTGGGRSDLARRRIGENLARLRRERNTADYRDPVPRLVDTAQKALARATSTMQDLAGL